MRFQFGWRQAVAVAMLLIIGAVYIVLRQQGTVSIDSKEGSGTTVTVVLPAAIA